MKKGLHFLGRKNQSLYDTNIKIPDRDSVQLVLEETESAICESGTANVRARPTVKHHTFSFETFQGLAVPTPKVPELPPANGPIVNGTGAGDHSSNGSVVSVPGHMEEKIFVPPPPPSAAPPPPPVDFIPPPPDFMGDLNSLDPVALQPPSMPAPKPPSMVEEDLSLLKPPPMAPPKPPNTCSTGSGSAEPVSVPPPTQVPERPKFAPPQPPAEKHQKSHKVPPPKPIRSSSVSIVEPPAQPPQVPTSTLSTFNPQNKAKVHDPPKHTVLWNASANPAPAEMKVDGKAPQTAQLPKPEPKPAQQPKGALEIKQPELPKVPEEPKTEAKTEIKIKSPTEAKADIVPAKAEITKSLQPPPLHSTTNVQINSESKSTLEVSPGQNRSFSPLLDRKLDSLKANEPKHSSTSPFALLKAAKEREKNKNTQSLSRESSTRRNEPTSPNSVTVIPRSTSSVLPSQNKLQESATHRPAETKTTIQAIETPMGSTALAKDQKLSTDPVLSKYTALSSPAVSNLSEQKQRAEEKQLKSHDVQNNTPKQDMNLPLLPPPPEFGDFGQILEQPPSIRLLDPPTQKAPTPPKASAQVTAQTPAKAPAPTQTLAQTPAKAPAPTQTPAQTPAKVPAPTQTPAQTLAKAPAPTQAPAPTPAKAPAKTQATAPSPPKLPPSDIQVKPKPLVQTKSNPPSTQVPPNISQNQATLLSILQKKMLVMDQKMAPVNDSEHNSDDWSTGFSDEDNKVPAVPQSKQQTKNPPAPANKTASLDMKELETKIMNKYQSTQVKSPTKNGMRSRQKYGMTFTIRPGTKQPITLASKED
ncbi:proline-rich extensin-like protein EPR1 isoform X2 [Poecilia reticulata]|uniref:proline-rich extensin-like protein EPR1 isoform X2 n=1 Tax=Poecilia reticulata TaxID=8081 RepID=UPI0004A3D5E1|nr:PREDICTED: proline-rich extensin-like protein EPR1 isoform X2 [Poecilia reticulata]